MFEDCGLGKTLQQLSWAEAVACHTGRSVLLLCPIGVKHQTFAEASRFGIRCPVVDAGQYDGPRAIELTNYQRLHHVDPTRYAGVVLDESSILKSFTGSVKRQLVESFAATPYRLACTATPAPNDHMELGNHSEFLGVMKSNEMLSRWFINDAARVGSYRLKGHATDDFWAWVASWAVCLSSPSDMGGDDAGYQLPPLDIRRHHVATPDHDPAVGQLFATTGVSATNIHSIKRLTLVEQLESSGPVASRIGRAVRDMVRHQL